jgi:hypothetical protein
VGRRYTPAHMVGVASVTARKGLPVAESSPLLLTPAVELLTRAASLYYLEGLAQEDITAKLGLSRPKVGRLLKQAKRFGDRRDYDQRSPLFGDAAGR